MSFGNLLQEWITDYCAPVIIVVATEEAERISLQNGLLLHELFSCFNRLDGVNGSIRVGQQVIQIPDGHVRFERATEAKAKTPDVVEEALITSFKPFDIKHLPNSVAEVKAEPPSSWNRNIEQIIARSMSFTECDMISNPVIILTIVATSDRDPVAAMQELSSTHHAPPSVTNGQYDGNIHKIYVLLEDATEKKKDALSVLRGLNSYFPPAYTKLLSINSFATPNLHQPDMWSRSMVPKYFPSQSPSLNGIDVPLNPATQQLVFGSRLSVDDFMKIRDFCFWLYSDQVIPILEKRLNSLTRQVNDSRKGVKNVLKSFWRKPKEESDNPKGGVKYRHDKIESQTLLLGDLSFMLKDYDTAMSMYRLARDDFKADKSMLHLTHSLLMSAVCQIVCEPHKYREVHGVLDTIAQCMAGGLEIPHSHAFFALLSSEIYCFHSQARAPLDAARILLQASSAVIKFPLLSSLLVERAASFFMQSNHVRKYILHNVIAGLKMHKINRLPIFQHSTVCYATSILLLEKGNWGDLKTKLTKTLSDDFRTLGREGAQRSLLFLLKILASMLQERSEIVGIASSYLEAVSILNEILSDGVWGNIRINEGWMNIPYRDLILNPLPISPLSLSLENDISKSKVEVVGLPVPEILVKSIAMIEPINGYYLYDHNSYNNEDKLSRLLLMNSLNIEKNWIKYHQEKHQSSSSSSSSSQGQAQSQKSTTTTTSEKSLSHQNEALHQQFDEQSLEECIVRAEKDFLLNYHNYHRLNPSSDYLGTYNSDTTIPKISKNEKILVKMTLKNKLPIDIVMNKIHLEVNKNEDFEIHDISMTINADNTQEIILQIIPKEIGEYFITNIQWNLSDTFTVIQPLKRKGKLLHKTIQQRANYERTKDHFFKFQIIDTSPLLSLKFEGLSSEILQGQLLKSFLIMKNDGTAPAKNIFIKLSHPSFVFYLSNQNNNGNSNGNGDESGKFLNFYGHSSTIVYLENIVIPPGEEIRLEAWLRLTQVGEEKVSLLVSYEGPNSPDSKYSYISIKSRGLPSVGVATQIIPRTSTTNLSMLVTEITNCIVDEHEDKEIIRLSSVGQLDIPDLEEHFIDVDRNNVKVVGLLMTGNTSPCQPNKNASHFKKPLMTTPTERLTNYWPIKNSNEKLANRSKSHQITIEDGWLFNSLPEMELDKSLKLTNNQVKSIIEQFIVIWYTHNEFMKKIHDAKEYLILEELEASAAGPRSIQEVRRERQKLKESAGSTKTDGLVTIFENGNDESKNTTDDHHDHEHDHPHPHHHVNYSMANIAKKESSQNSIGLTVIWVCRWQEKIRWGMHHIPFVSILSFQLLSKDMQSSLSQPFIPSSPNPDPDIQETPMALAMKNPLSFLQVAIHHEKQIIWDDSPSDRVVSETFTEDVRKLIKVQLTIKSHAKRAICFSIQTMNHQFSNMNKIGNQNNEIILTKLTNVGFSWTGKSRYNRLVISPHQEMSLTFMAEVLRPGIYNLNRFGIISEFVDDDETHLHTTETTWTTLPGSSLLTALPSKDL